MKTKSIIFAFVAFLALTLSACTLRASAPVDNGATQNASIIGTLTAGSKPYALDPPSDDEVVQALEKARPVRGGIPLLFERQRNNVQIVKEKIADYVDPPRFIPLIGMASLHHAHYKCTIYFSERTINGWPVPYTLEDKEAFEVVYIDHNQFHMFGNQNTTFSLSISVVHRLSVITHSSWRVVTTLCE